ncbi:alpha/beta hydrolase [Natronomonas salina]|uniref:alpha/beta hydrolase family protein n=1 Tax=Natronomonas salina TaxID=1710540 RepID=UPI0015B7112F|nr:alpha/beta hydrolase [Natronomonas salina]QLD90163.1 alpha/beta hydrolase [Natronomonas salina]
MAESHDVQVEGGESVAAVHHGASAASDDWLFFCHGFRSDKSGSYERRCERAVEEGYRAVRFDFRGSGESDRAFVDATLSSRIADLRAVLDYFDPEAYALFGSSFGAKVALHAACEGPSGANTSGHDRLRAVVGRAPLTYNRAFEEYRDLVAEAGTLQIDDDHAIDEGFFEDFDRYDFVDVAAGVDVPVALFHGTDDASVPLTDSLEAAAALETDVLLQKYRGEGHVFSEAAEARLLCQTFDWLATV